MAECNLFPGAEIYPQADLLPCFGYTEWRNAVEGVDGWAKEVSGADGWSKVTPGADGWVKE